MTSPTTLAAPIRACASPRPLPGRPPARCGCWCALPVPAVPRRLIVCGASVGAAGPPQGELFGRSNIRSLLRIVRSTENSARILPESARNSPESARVSVRLRLWQPSGSERMLQECAGLRQADPRLECGQKWVGCGGGAPVGGGLYPPVARQSGPIAHSLSQFQRRQGLPSWLGERLG